MNCPACGNDNPKGSQFCAGCGASLSAYTARGIGVGRAELPFLAFPDAIKIGFKRYFDFSGRSTRAEFCWWVLFAILVLLIFPPSVLVTLIPFISVSARRLHDINRTGLWSLLWLVPVIGWTMLIVWGIKRGDEGPNIYGPDPRQTKRYDQSFFRPRLNYLLRAFLRRL